MVVFRGGHSHRMGKGLEQNWAREGGEDNGRNLVGVGVSVPRCIRDLNCWPFGPRPGLCMLFKKSLHFRLLFIAPYWLSSQVYSLLAD